MTMKKPPHPGLVVLQLSRFFGGAEEGWLVQQAQYDLAQVRRDRIKLKRLELASLIKSGLYAPDSIGVEVPFPTL